MVFMFIMYRFHVYYVFWFMPQFVSNRQHAFSHLPPTRMHGVTGHGVNEPVIVSGGRKMNPCGHRLLCSTHMASKMGYFQSHIILVTCDLTVPYSSFTFDTTPF